MEAVQYLCEFFFCDGFASFGRLIIVGILFWCLSPKSTNYIVNGNEGNDDSQTLQNALNTVISSLNETINKLKS